MRVSNQIVISPNEPCYKTILEYSKKHLTLINPEYANKARMGFWLGNTPKTLDLYQIIEGNLVLPYGTLKQILTLFPNINVERGFAMTEPIDYKCSIPLYDYQIKARDEMVKGFYGILQSKAGSGKTQIGISVIAKLQRKALWLTTTRDLLNQSKERAERYMDSSLIGKITEGKVTIGKGVTFATIQTMCKLDLSQYKDMWDVVIVDECHRVAGTPTQMSMFAKVLNSLSARHKFGLSATVHRSDGMIQATFALLGEVVYTVPDEAVADKVMQVGIKPIGTGVKVSRECLNTDGTLNYTKLINYLCESDERNDVIHRHIVSESDKSCLILSDRLEHLTTLMSVLPLRMRPYATMISGKMTTKKGKAEREQALEDMRTGKKKYLFATYSLAKEGLDIPCLERLFMATPQKDYAVITQSIGRIARTYEGKADPICYDFVDDIGYLVKSYKKRCATYKKNDCYFIGENE
jgi:superfamily II DNA or RNA helicase